MIALIPYLLATAGLQLEHPTSVSDYREFTEFCQRAADNSEVFASFRQSSTYQAILEHVGFECGRMYLDIILKQSPEFLDQIDRFRTNDTIGGPATYYYDETGVISPTTLRYVKVASDLKLLFGDALYDSSIIEIGGGYGGQCKILSDLCHFKKYTIVDLPGPLALIKRYLEALNIENVTLRTFDEVIEGENFDLVISNYGYTECSPSMQEKYAREILANARRGYMTCSEGGEKKVESFDRLRRHGISFFERPETPPIGFCQNGDPNYVVIWGSES
ncbi:MAG: putative sugar O-methyltransferase [Verrucomicrobia bacterium]|nr:putative sugar O-methyltransferase [Verrucomicrobiota bacterium]